MVTIEIGTLRADGRFPVTTTYAGAPNAFGGHYPARVFRTLKRPDALLELVEKYGSEAQREHWLPVLRAYMGIKKGA